MNSLIEALAAGLVDPEEAAAILGRSMKHAGGRPKGSKQMAPDALEKAVAALSKRRRAMTPTEKEESEQRVAALLAGGHRTRKPLEKELAARATDEEKAVAGVYCRQEDRIGASRQRKMRRVALRNKHTGEIVAGYVSDAEPCVVNFTDHGLAGKSTKRSWLAPVTDAGKNGHAYAVPEPSVGEGWARWMEDESAESDWSGCLIEETMAGRVDGKDVEAVKAVEEMDLGQRGACGRRLMTSLPRGSRPLQRVPECLPRCEDAEKLVGEYQTRWRKWQWRKDGQDGQDGQEDRKPDKWQKPTGWLMAPDLAKDDPALWPEVQQMVALGAWRKAGCPLPVIQPVVEGWLPKPLDVVYDVAEAKPASTIWSNDSHGWPLKGTDDYWDRRFRMKDSDSLLLAAVADRSERVKRPDRTRGWNVLPIMSPSCGYVQFLA